MPAKKQKKTDKAANMQEQEQKEEEFFGRMEARLTKTFDERLLEFQKAIQSIAKNDDEAKDRAATKKQHNPAPLTTYDTRNKALRARYNPGMEVPVDIPIQQNVDLTHEILGQAADAINTKVPDGPSQQPSCTHALNETQNVNIRPTLRDANPTRMTAGNRDKNLDMNQWIVDKVMTNNQGGAARFPMSTRDVMEDELLDQRAHNILASARTNIARGNVRSGLFPFKYVFRGDELKCATMNSLTVSDHCWAIMRMIRDEAVPSEIKPHLITHVEQVLEDSRSYNWATAVRPWSNEIFSRVAEGRLTDGWASYNEIQLLRISISQTSIAKLTQNDGHQPFRSGQANATGENLRGGPPCVNFNSQKGCPLPSGHIVNGQKLTHICAFCLFNASAARPHSEYFCRNKQRQGNQPHF